MNRQQSKSWEDFMKPMKQVVCLFSMMSMTSACSNSQFLKSMNVSVTNDSGGASYVNLSSEVNLGNVYFDNITIPVNSPKTQEELGKITLGTAPSGRGLIMMSLNATTIAHGDAGLGSTLPNGRPLPARLGANNDITGIPVLKYSRAYLGGDLQSNIVIGVALAIRYLDGAAGNLPSPGNIFFSQTFNANLWGIGGVYASPDPNETGIAVFARYTNTNPAQVESLRLASVMVAPLSVKGSTPKNKGNQMVNENMSSKATHNLMSYFYGEERVLSPQ